MYKTIENLNTDQVLGDMKELLLIYLCSDNSFLTFLKSQYLYQKKKNEIQSKIIKAEII